MEEKEEMLARIPCFKVDFELNARTRRNAKEIMVRVSVER